MIVDTSALLAIILDEPERERFRSALARADTSRVSAATLVEAGTVVLRRGGEPLAAALDALVAASGLVIEPFTPAQA